MLEREILKKVEKTRYQSQPGLQAEILHRPYRKKSPKRQVRVHVSGRVKKGPFESKG
jgi:hypothetical protein